MARLGNVCIINPKSPRFQDEFAVSFVPMHRVGENGELDPSEVKTYQEVKKGFAYFQDGDVLFAKITPCMENGKGAIAQFLENGIGFGSTEFHVLRPQLECVTSKWLFYLLSWETFRKEAEKSMTGSAGQKRVPKSFLEGYAVNVPNLSAQAEITDTLDKICGLISLRKQQLVKLDELVKARFAEMFGDPVQNSKGFPTRTGAEFFKLTNGKPVPEEKRQRAGVPAYGGNGISWYTDEVLFERDTLVVGRVGFQSGNVHYAKGPLWVTDNAMYITEYSVNKYDLIFLSALMEHIDFTRFQDPGDLKKITQKPFMQMDYICPPLSYQKKFTDFVKRADKFRLTIQQSHNYLETLKKSMMQKYFTS